MTASEAHLLYWMREGLVPSGVVNRHIQAEVCGTQIVVDLFKLLVFVPNILTHARPRISNTSGTCFTKLAALGDQLAYADSMVSVEGCSCAIHMLSYVWASE